MRRRNIIITSATTVLIIWYVSSTKNPLPCPVGSIQPQLNTLKEYETFLLIIVLTGPRNKDRRDAMRQTWLSEHSQGIFANKNTHISHVFVLGTEGLTNDLRDSLAKEKMQHNDLLLLEQFADAYQRLTDKLGETLIWVNSNVECDYIFKCDDDTYARIDVVGNELSTRHRTYPHEMLYLGFFYGKGKVKKSGPWKETAWKLCDMYIPYARGGGYVLSSDVISYVASNFAHFKRYLSEDVSMGSWLAPLEVNRVHDIRFDTEYKTRGCSNTFVVSHKQSVEDMRDKYNSLKSTGKLCRKEFSNFHGYEYDWNLPPSQCCVRKESIP